VLTAQAQHELPGEVLGTSIYYTEVGSTSVTVNWAEPDLGAYKSAITGYELQMAEVCEAAAVLTPVGAEGFPMQAQPVYTDPANPRGVAGDPCTGHVNGPGSGPCDAGTSTSPGYPVTATTAYVDPRNLRNAAALAIGNTGTPYNTYVGSATIGMSSADAAVLDPTVATTDVTGATDVSSWTDKTVIDTLVAPSGGYGVYTMAACTSAWPPSAWAPVRGVYTPLSGQNHEVTPPVLSALQCVVG
jgi:hypothetical protein